MRWDGWLPGGPRRPPSEESVKDSAPILCRAAGYGIPPGPGSGGTVQGVGGQVADNRRTRSRAGAALRGPEFASEVVAGGEEEALASERASALIGRTRKGSCGAEAHNRPGVHLAPLHHFPDEDSLSAQVSGSPASLTPGAIRVPGPGPGNHRVT